jgi:predicted component of type VI protein secretion system
MRHQAGGNQVTHALGHHVATQPRQLHDLVAGSGAAEADGIEGIDQGSIGDQGQTPRRIGLERVARISGVDIEERRSLWHDEILLQPNKAKSHTQGAAGHCQETGTVGRMPGDP